jgi:hypothetical protein
LRRASRPSVARVRKKRRASAPKKSAAAPRTSARAKSAAIGAAVLLIVGGIGGGLALKNANDKAAADEARHQQELAEQKAQSDALQRQLESQTQNLNALVAQLASAKDDAAKEALQKQIEDAKRAQAATRQNYQRVQSGGGGGGGGSPKPRPACTCQSGDPLCSCIQ